MNKVVSLGILQNKLGEVLIIRRAKKEKGVNKSQLNWAFPGGEIEKNESKEDAVKREVLEETGYKVEVKKIISERQHPQFPVYIYYLACELKKEDQSSTSDRDIEEHKWIQPKDLKKYFTSNLDEKVSNYLNL